MTDQDAKEILEEVKNKVCSRKYVTDMSEAFDVAIDLLDQAASEYAINKDELVSKLEILDKMYGSDFYWEVRKIVDSLSPVRPVRKKAKWIRVAGGSLIDDYRCSECNNQPPIALRQQQHTWGWDFTEFCPKCGSDMEGVEPYKGK